MTPSLLPQYIEDAGFLPVFRGPYMLQDSQISASFLKADKAHLTALCDKYLNSITYQGGEGDFIYKPISSYVMLTYADMIGYSLNPEQRQIGKLRETDLSFWILTVAFKKYGDEYVADHFAWFLPFLYVDNPYAIFSGREVYGFRKTPAVFTPPANFHDPEYSAEVYGFKNFAPEEMCQRYTLMEMKKASTSRDAPFGVDWLEDHSTMNNILRIIQGLLEVKDGKIFIEGINAAVEFADLFSLKQMQMVFIKQYRDISTTTNACYQAVVEAPVRPTQFQSGGLILGNYNLTINDLASHPLISSMGLVNNNGTISIQGGFWTVVDFVMEEGKVIAYGNAKKKKIAVLGGGAGALSAAFGLTSLPDWQHYYDITVYQLGWRLGGKGASGRNPARGERIEEHGLHIWLGFYENAFAVMQQAYAEMNRPSTAPLATWDAAFKQHNFIALTEYVRRDWKVWPFNFPVVSGVPGQGGRQYWPLNFVKKILTSLLDYLNLLELPTVATVPAVEHQWGLEGWVVDHLEKAGVALPAIEHKAELAVFKPLLSAAIALTDGFDDIPESRVKQLSLDEKNDLITQFKAATSARSAICLSDEFQPLRELMSPLQVLWHLLEEIWNLLQKFLELIGILDALRRFGIMLELGIVTIRGMLADGVILHGYDVIDNLDFRQWLIQNGASDDAAYSAPVRAFYDLAISYPDGYVGTDEPTRAGNVSAGVALHSLFLMAFAYKGSIMWKMQAGMGDVVFTPLYEVLKKRGVQFKFFHKITDLVPTDSGDGIAKIIYNEQVTLKDSTVEYQPLVDVKGLPCWPSTPLYAQIVQGDELIAKQINLESRWADWQDVKVGETLELGKDFDLVVCGIPVMAVKLISSQLSTINPRWKAMLDNANAVRTLALQTWNNKTLAQLGWKDSSPVLDAYAQRFNTWADMSQTIPAEAWSPEYEPLNIAYFCGPLAGNDLPPPSDHQFPQQKLDEVLSGAKDWIAANANFLWPAARQLGRFDWNVFIDPQNQRGSDRLNSQYWRANVDPSELYTLCVANTSQYRLKTNETGFNNLFIAGDWIDNGFLNIGCVEATVISGLQAAEAITGVSMRIVY